MTPGSLSILNVGLGDIEFRFDTGDPAEVEKARRAIEDMLGRGYTILVDDGAGQLRRATGFDLARGVYIIDKVPGEPAREVPMTGATATGIAPTAGG
jgi:hypothetical protein